MCVYLVYIYNYKSYTLRGKCGAASAQALCIHLDMQARERAEAGATRVRPHGLCTHTQK